MNTELTKTIKVITILNPLEVQNYQEEFIEFKPNLVLVDLIPSGMECVVAVSGGIVPFEQWTTYLLNEDDTVVIHLLLL